MEAHVGTERLQQTPPERFRRLLLLRSECYSRNTATLGPLCSAGI
jgi:hypothetical protein